jgi:hypothetical protein
MHAHFTYILAAAAAADLFGPSTLSAQARVVRQPGEIWVSKYPSHGGWPLVVGISEQEQGNQVDGSTHHVKHMGS